MKKTAKARAKTPPKPAKASKRHRCADMFRETAPLLLALAVVDTRDSVDEKGRVIESVWLTMAKSQLEELTKAEREACLVNAKTVLTLMTAWGGE